jgi:3-demethoxyubiquinol 3-hydroxylase
MDKLLIAFDSALRTLFARSTALVQPKYMPATDESTKTLSQQQKKLSAALMRVNHVGEVCAQALYTAQALVSRNPNLRQQYQAACQEEAAHLSWTMDRLQALDAKPSYLNPVWYVGSFMLGLVAGSLRDGISLGFVAETERQVGQHLQSHVLRLPKNDLVSLIVIEQMILDECEHAHAALIAGAVELPWIVRQWMCVNAKIMTSVAHYI